MKEKRGQGVSQPKEISHYLHGIEREILLSFSLFKGILVQSRIQFMHPLPSSFFFPPPHPSKHKSSLFLSLFHTTILFPRRTRYRKASKRGRAAGEETDAERSLSQSLSLLFLDRSIISLAWGSFVTKACHPCQSSLLHLTNRGISAFSSLYCILSLHGTLSFHRKLVLSCLQVVSSASSVRFTSN